MSGRPSSYGVEKYKSAVYLNRLREKKRKLDLIYHDGVKEVKKVRTSSGVRFGYSIPMTKEEKEMMFDLEVDIRIAENTIRRRTDYSPIVKENT